MRLQSISALGLLAFAVVVHAGCGEPPTCPAGAIGPFDNRDGTMFPHSAHNWLCFKAPSYEPPPLPDLGGDKPVDAPGPKDMEAVAKAAIFLDTCLRDTGYGVSTINERIDLLYNTHSSSSILRAIAARLQCFKDKTNGCEALRECLGILVTPDDPRYGEGCYEGVGMVRTGSSSGIRNAWINCTGLGLECYEGKCRLPREPCTDPAEMPFCTDDGAPRDCAYDSGQDAYSRALLPSCAQYGLECDSGTWGAICQSSGPACTPNFQSPLSTIADFRAGIECADGTTLRACVIQHEMPVDCASLGQGFVCIGGSRPHCAADFQCDYEGWNLSTTCEGNFVEVCNAGVRMAFDCVALGFESCHEPLGACKAKPQDPVEQ